jgi:DNA-binding transcriptional LysR family regulator
MRIEDLKAFVVVADVASFRTAAELLNVTQSTLTRRIQKLESMLNTQLLTRSTRFVRLTSEGLEFLEKIRTVVIDAETVILETRAGSSRQGGLIRIGVLPSLAEVMLPPVLSAFLKGSPRIAFRILDQNALGIVRMMAEGKVDIGIGIRVGDGTDLLETPLFDEPIGIVCDPAHPAARDPELTWAKLAKFPFAYNLGESGNRLIITHRLEEHGLKLNWIHQVGSLSGALAVARSGMALAAVPASIAEMVAPEQLVFRRVREPEISRRVILLERPDDSGSVRREKMRQFIRETDPTRFGGVRLAQS